MSFGANYLGGSYFGEGYDELLELIESGPPALPVSYSTMYVYAALPQFVRDADAAAPITNDNPFGYPLYYFLYGICQYMDQLNVLYFDDMGAGVTLQPTDLYPEAVTEAYLVASVDPVTDVFYIFGTDETWNQIDTSEAFVLQIEQEEILVPAGTYDWLAPSLLLTGVQRSYDNTLSSIHLASSGADGVIDLKNFAGAPGWSQAIDIRRCPEYALPWLGQFVGAGLPQSNSLTYEQALNKIETRSGFQRATVASIVAELVTVINSQLPATSKPLASNQVIVLENTTLLASSGANLAVDIDDSTTTLTLTNTNSSWNTLGSNSAFVLQIGTEDILFQQGDYNWLGSPITFTGVTRGYNSTVEASHVAGSEVTLVSSTDIYGFDEYAFTLLLPASYYNVFTYDSLVAAAGEAATYNDVIAFVDTLGGYYDDLSGSTFPTNDSPYINFVYRYRPAGIQVYIGGY
jgi:hypothetical protein